MDLEHMEVFLKEPNEKFAKMLFRKLLEELMKEHFEKLMSKS